MGGQGLDVDPVSSNLLARTAPTKRFQKDSGCSCLGYASHDSLRGKKDDTGAGVAGDISTCLSTGEANPPHC